MQIVDHKGKDEYILSRDIYDTGDKPKVITSQEMSDKETNKELVIQYIQNSSRKGISIGELQQAVPALSHKQVRLLLEKLREEGLVELQGEKKGARWRLI
jgi:DNA-binding transcriptional ArsR family regulator